MPPAASPARPLESKLIAGLFLLALGFNLWGVSVGWKDINLVGHEFRQAQTAISAVFIQQDHDFSLAYPMPVLGKPWSVPFEFPLYQWTVVLTSNVTGMPLTEAGRLISVLCFYLCLPALFLLLRRLGLRGLHALVAVSFVLVSPLYIFYARAFLIETMALMFGLWYALALIHTLERRRLSWLLLVNLAGIGAGLVKVTTLMVFLLPAFVWSIWLLWQARPRLAAPRWGPLLRTFGWLVAAHALPFLATAWWIHFSDAVKALNPSGIDFQSAKLTGWNFGTGQKFSGEAWSAIWQIISQQLAWPGTLLAGGLLAAVFARRWWRPIALLLAWYGLVLFTFPVLYAWHAYYHVANAFLLMLALGLALAGAFASDRLPRPVAFGLWLTFLLTQMMNHLEYYHPLYRQPGNAGGLAEVLGDILQPDESIIIAGDDWNSMLPYYARRRALMIRADLVNDPRYLHAAFTAMKGESVGALVLFDEQRGNHALRRLAQDTFGLNLQPFLTWRDRGRNAVVYLSRQIRATTANTPHTGGYYGIEFPEASVPPENFLAGRALDYQHLLGRHRRLFRLMSPRPVRFYATFGPELWDENKPGSERFAAHADTKLWFALPPGRHRVRTDIDLVPGAWQDVPDADASDGVELVAAAVFPDGRHEILQSRYLNPRANPADRGAQPIDWTFALPDGAGLELSVNGGPAGNGARDWATLGPITIN
jgi:hypothetical protein